MKHPEDISKELKELSSILSEQSRSMPYEVPDGYFNEFTVNIADHLQLKEQAGANMPGVVPERYFETLPSQLLNKIKQDTPRKGNTINLTIRWAVAAALLVLVSIGGYHVMNTGDSSFEKQLATIPESELSEYINNNINQFDIETIENELLADNNTGISTQQLHEDDIVNYLNETGWADQIK